MKKWIGRVMLIVAFASTTGSVFAQDLYMDQTTGQVFAAPGPNRVKLKDEDNGNDKKDKPSATDAKGNTANGDKHESGLIQDHNFLKGYEFTDVPNQSAHRPADPQKEKLTIYGRLQFRGISGSQDTNFSNGNSDFQAIDWNVRRLRLGAMYEGADWWGGVINIRLENLVARPELSPAKTTNVCTNAGCTTTAAAVTTPSTLSNNRGAIQEAVGWLQSKFANTRLTFGQINVPFNREYIGSSQNMVNVERSMITAALPQFDMGVMLTVHPLKEIFGPKYTQYLALNGYVGNGRGAGGDYGTGRKTDLYNTRNGNATNVLTSPTYVWRVTFNPLGGLVNQVGKEVGWHEGEEIFQKETKWSIGASGWQTENFATINNSTLNNIVDAYPRGMPNIAMVTPQSTPDGGTSALYGIPFSYPGSSSTSLVQNNSTTPGTPRFGLIAHNYDTTFTSNGFYLNGAFTKMSGPASNNTTGYHVTVGYNIPILSKYYIMPVLRYDYLQGDYNRNGKIDPQDTFKSYWAGVNIFLDKHLMKIQVFYNNFHTMLGQDAITGAAKPLDNQVIIVQAQFSFQTGVTTKEKYYSAAEGRYRAE
ncbi:hypothetical protein EHQ53_09160 [Leptospira langatensis]|uniref:Porin n=1 Tax=Leptospira langatensis TaxID=2484983 RepID=A0A5F1ZVP8_9LEPT|nr:hypothetical protein [Leptospira langatensis]TGK01214.1 hypothetical protein EHO57_09715 [Leptospira langatensis]TGL42336.1 hypothetical protein EHQ53_09160 [Leptospira langatensis]